MLLASRNGYIEGSELDQFLYELVTSVNTQDVGPEDKLEQNTANCENIILLVVFAQWLQGRHIAYCNLVHGMEFYFSCASSNFTCLASQSKNNKGFKEIMEWFLAWSRTSWTGSVA
ncbi:calbindin-32 [Elysia marginata]|uniref:Calbindin-32 n=1 Tax=Elysia marginata TaxID=1093978 RepID=A0AAV4H266_9GAST|nr:calbindin-32 [Elysia marginata]